MIDPSEFPKIKEKTSDIVFTGEEEVFKRDIDYTKYQDQIQLSKEINGPAAADDFYTVPENKTLFIVSAFITGINTTAAQIYKVNLTINEPTDSRMIIAAYTAPNNGVGHNSITFPNAIKVYSGQTVRINKGGGALTQAIGGFTGWLLDNRIS